MIKHGRIAKKGSFAMVVSSGWQSMFELVLSIPQDVPNVGKKQITLYNHIKITEEAAPFENCYSYNRIIQHKGRSRRQ